MTTAPTFHLLLCGPLAAWRDDAAAELAGLWPEVVAVHRLSRDNRAGTLHDQQGLASRRLGVRPSEPAHYLVRPDGYIGYRATGTDLTGLRGYLQHWLAAGSRTRPEKSA
jgi:hypothetical protein